VDLAVAKLTCASKTPGTSLRAFSIRAAQALQLMPSTKISVFVLAEDWFIGTPLG
jgi:hypothetical protein